MTAPLRGGDVAEAPETDIGQSIPLGVKLTYSAPGIPLQMMNFASLAILPTFYAKNTMATLAGIGGVLLVTRLFDAGIHPLVGFLSDRTLHWKGGRKGWVMLGSVLSAPAVFFLFTPPRTAGATYFAVWSVLLFASWAIMEIPYRAWGAELSRDYKERSRIFAIMSQLRMAGVLLFVGIPLLPFFRSSDLTRPYILHILAIVLAALLPITTLIAIATTPSGVPVAMQRSTFAGLLRAMRANRPLWLFGIVFALEGVGIGLYNSVHLLYVTTYLHLAAKFPFLAFVYFLVAVPMMAVWSRVMNRIGKHRAWALGLGGFALILPLYILIKPGPMAFPLALLMAVLWGLTATAAVVVPSAALGDIIDFDVLKTGVNRAGNYFALLQLVSMAEVAIGGGVGFLMLNWFHFNPKGANTAHAILGLQMTFAIVPAALYLAAAVLVLTFPIDEKRHRVIRRRLQERADRANRARSVA